MKNKKIVSVALIGHQDEEEEIEEVEE